MIVDPMKMVLVRNSMPLTVCVQRIQTEMGYVACKGDLVMSLFLF